MRIPPLVSGGVMLSYRCTNACRHCLYRCSPRRPDEWMSPETANRVFAALAREPRLDSVHLAGGEATLRFELLLETVRIARRHGVRVSYLETNARWCRDRRETREKLTALEDAGLSAILVSASMFHAEYVPFVRTRTCVEVGREVFGAGGVLVWLPHLYRALAEMPGEDRTHPLEQFCAHFGIAPDSPELPRLYQVIPGGRAPEALRACYALRPAAAFRGERCGGDLLSTSHFHVDLHGNLFTGLCAGIAPGDVDDFHPELAPEEFPVAHTLIERGPSGLADLATREHGFEPDPEGYASRCDLCYRVRCHLHEHGDYAELRPADYYEPEEAISR